MQDSNRPSVADQVAENAYTKLVARLSMIFIAGIAVPIIGIMLQRALADVDKVSDLVEDVRRVQGVSNYKLDMIGSTITDHEKRLRDMERR